MDTKEYEVLKAKFLKLIASVPLPLREEIIAVIDDRSLSWVAVYGEIKQDTDNAKNILNHLKKIGLV